MSCSVVSWSEATSEPPKVAPTCGVLYILTWTCASRHNDVHFFNIRTSKSGANMWCFVHFDLEMCFAPQRRALFRHLNFQKWSGAGVLCTFWLRHVLRASTACTFSTSQLPKMVRSWCVLYILTILTWKCASRYNGVRFFDIWTSTSGPNLVCFVHFDFEMCFAPQRRALFRHCNFQKGSDNGVFCTFWLGNVLHATTACNFSSLLWSAGSAPAALASLLFDPPEPQIIGKKPVFRDFPTFSRICIFFLLTLSLLLFSLLIFPFSLPLPCSAFHLSIFSEVWLLNFLRQPLLRTTIEQPWLTTMKHHYEPISIWANTGEMLLVPFAVAMFLPNRRSSSCSSMNFCNICRDLGVLDF